MSECSCGDPGTVILDGVETRIADLDDKNLRAMFGYGHFNPYHRSVLPGDWPHIPDTCQPDNHVGVWLDESHLACSGCGLDCT